MRWLLCVVLPPEDLIGTLQTEHEGVGQADCMRLGNWLQVPGRLVAYIRQTGCRCRVG